MLAEAHGITRIVIACGHMDLRMGIGGLSTIIGNNYSLNSFEKNVLFLFCGRKNDRIKALLWEDDGFLLLYNRLEKSIGILRVRNVLDAKGIMHTDKVLSWIFS